jgi:hypothetical protein
MTGLPTGLQVDIEFTAGVWTNVTTYVRSAPPISIKYGRTTPFDVPQVASCALVLDNADGRFTPHNAASAYWPNVMQRKRLRVTYNSGTSPLFLGYIKSWQASLDGGKAPLMAVAATDRFALLTQYVMKSVVEQEILALTPTTYIPLGDVIGSTSAAAFDGSASYPITLQGSGAASCSFGNTSPAGAWDTQTWAKFVPHVTGGVNDGGYIALAITPAGSTTSTCVIAFTSTNATTIQSFVSQPKLPGTAWVAMGSDASGNFHATVASSPFTTTSPVADGKVHVGILVQTPSSWTLYLDGVSVATGATPGGGQFPVYVGGDPSGPFADATLANFAWFEGAALTPTQVTTIGNAIQNGFTGELTGARMQRYLGYTSLRSSDWNLAAGQQTMGPALCAGKNVVTACRDAAVTEGGGAVVFVDTDGRIRFVDRTFRSTGTAVITFDAQLNLPPNSWAPVLDDYAVVNDSTVTRQGGGVTEYVNTTSKAANGLILDSVTTFQDNDADAYRLAQYRANGGQAIVRMPTFTCDFYKASNSATLYTALPTITIGSRARVSNIPATWTNASGATMRLFNSTQLDGYIEGWSLTIAADSFAYMTDLSPADNPALMLWDDTTYGRWQPDTGALTLTANIDNAVTSMQITTGGSTPTLSTAAGDYPTYILLDEEIIKLNGVPGGSTSPQTFTVTRAQQGTFADAHLAGAIVTGWPECSWTL